MKKGIKKILGILIAFALAFGLAIPADLSPAFAAVGNQHPGGGEAIYYSRGPEGDWHKWVQDVEGGAIGNSGTVAVTQNSIETGQYITPVGDTEPALCANMKLSAEQKFDNVRYRLKARDYWDNISDYSGGTALDEINYFNSTAYDSSAGSNHVIYGDELYNKVARAMYYGYPCNAAGFEGDEYALLCGTQGAIYLAMNFGGNTDVESGIEAVLKNDIYDQLVDIINDNSMTVPADFELYVYVSTYSYGTGFRGQNLLGCYAPTVTPVVKEPEIKNTTAKVNGTEGAVTIDAGSEGTMTDEVEFANLESDVTYTIKSYLYKDGEEFGSPEETTVTSNDTSPITVTFKTKITEAGTYKVKTELIASGDVVATHNGDLDIESETVTVTTKGSLKTTVSVDGKSASSDSAVEVQIIGDSVVKDVVDKIDYNGLTKGATYTVSGTLVEVDEEGNVVDENVATASEELEAKDTKGTWEITFEGVTLKPDKKYVVFEEAVNKEDETDKAEHKDPADNAQTVVTVPYTGELIDIEVTKSWVGTNPNASPKEITVKLLDGGNETGDTLTLNEENNWTGSFESLPADGDYSVTEEPVEYYIMEVAGDQESGFKITNVTRPWVPKIPGTPGEEEYGSFTLAKTVSGGAETDKAFKITVTMTLPDKTTYKETVSLKSTDEAKLFDYVPAGTEVEITEEAEGYTMTCKVDGKEATKFTVKDGDKLEVIVNNDGGKSSKKGVNTGDDTTILPHIMLLVSAAALSMAMAYRKKSVR